MKNNICAIKIKMDTQTITPEQTKRFIDLLAQKKSEYWELYGADVQYKFDIKDGKNRANT